MPGAGARRSETSVALVTGAGSGVGLELVRELVARGAPVVYAGVRDPATVTDQFDGHAVQVVPLDITDPRQVSAAADTCGDVSLLINNAGYASTERLGGVADDTAAPP